MDHRASQGEGSEGTGPGAIEAVAIWGLRLLALPFLAAGLVVWALVLGLAAAARWAVVVPATPGVRVGDLEVLARRGGPVAKA